ncbi:hypothetical protein RvY_16655 [Ramazzottius varieornatus]|uniref:Uncharacterized protein n=1 Tax=Ramazzottius varieornatus TaxID=947166 RepID=A0A1D1VZ99_RAMVA|nr:hypothetical protein RvY_16655 [Ramazzottius varieornatus]
MRAAMRDSECKMLKPASKRPLEFSLCNALAETFPASALNARFFRQFHDVYHRVSCSHRHPMVSVIKCRPDFLARTTLSKRSFFHAAIRLPSRKRQNRSPACDFSRRPPSGLFGQNGSKPHRAPPHKGLWDTCAVHAPSLPASQS